MVGSFPGVCWSRFKHYQKIPSCPAVNSCGALMNRIYPVPDFMTAGSLPVKRESELFQAPNDLTVAETGQPSHQEPSTSGKSKESASSGSGTAC